MVSLYFKLRVVCFRRGPLSSELTIEHDFRIFRGRGIVVIHSVDMLKPVVSTYMEFSSKDSISKFSSHINFFLVRERREDAMSFKFVLLNSREQGYVSQSSSPSSSLSSSSFRAQEVFLLEAAPWLKRLVAGFPPRGPGSNPGLVMWDLWWIKWRWGRFFPNTSVSPANLYSAHFSTITITITYHPGLVQ
jgi:hypothetical protein